MDQIQDSHHGHQVRYIQASGWLIGMERNARGIISVLENKVYTEMIGDEPGTQRGKPILACLDLNQTGF
ncbi:hypothetical protein OJ967_04185 [Peribacillus frigoritolerans]|uniref:hypothetical protein n=1 Tax=Peribacillus frigoritolerans TaxID=450367 RepID=UPI0022270214|nr:hypothetical protein [Peribacillus frigoritolerans]UYY99741.1 hypothetical protein OJ967_04185 [Peribacillus frigoritolerans]